MRYSQNIENEDGWTDWIQIAEKHFIKCCDCGLVHRLEVKKERGLFYFRVSRKNKVCLRCGENQGEKAGCGNAHGTRYFRHKFS